MAGPQFDPKNKPVDFGKPNENIGKPKEKVSEEVNKVDKLVSHFSKMGLGPVKGPPGKTHHVEPGKDDLSGILPEGAKGAGKQEEPPPTPQKPSRFNKPLPPTPPRKPLPSTPRKTPIPKSNKPLPPLPLEYTRVGNLLRIKNPFAGQEMGISKQSEFLAISVRDKKPTKKLFGFSKKKRNWKECTLSGKNIWVDKDELPKNHLKVGEDKKLCFREGAAGKTLARGRRENFNTKEATEALKFLEDNKGSVKSNIELGEVLYKHLTGKSSKTFLQETPSAHIAYLLMNDEIDAGKAIQQLKGLQDG